MNFDQIPPIENKQYTTPTKEQMEFLDAWLKNHPDEVIPMEMRRDCEKEKDELISLFNKFEEIHSLKDLTALDIFPPKTEDIEKYQIRIAAKNDLIPIVALLNALKDKTNIPDSEYNKLKEGYKILSRAVGMVNGGKIDHTR
ncbi:MAG: hypothetical protein NTW62_00250 [Candidatus Nomurabacteria bacterium]|nr:hypothetical protein [Candidatus Nomurabacteria bacterium]